MLSTKKVVSGMMAGALALSMAVPAFAADTTITTSDALSTGGSTEITGTTTTPTIKVTVPGTGGVVINPYKMSVKVDLTGGTNKAVNTDQVLSTPWYIKSESDVKLDVYATVTGKAEGNAVFATGELKGSETTNSVFMYLEALPATKDSSATLGFAAPTWATEFDKSKHIVLSNGKAATMKTAIATIEAAEFDGDVGETGYAIKSGEYTGVGFHLVGELATKPTKAWASTDKISATVAYTFVAQNDTTTGGSGS